ncbi:MAG: class I SAM-dependent methyltransferase [Acidobacteriota bacterium]|nr:class I SAM-dependent methyltransferase [Acidobacteriota bacterium]
MSVEHSRALQAATAFWDREVVERAHPIWLAHPLVREYVNRQIGGTGGSCWPLDWFQRHYPQRFPLALSIGCGSGGLERDALRRGISAQIDAFDASPESLAIARAEAAREGMSDALRYYPDDFERADLPPRKYDLIIFQQSLHHVGRLERLLRLVRRALKPNGVVYLDEYIGPSRTYWNEQTFVWYRALFELLPRPLRYAEPFGLPVQWEDLSEAIRSGEIVSRLKIGFEIERFQGYGGNLLAIMFPLLAAGADADDVVKMLVEAEKRLIEGGAPPFHALIVARPRRGMKGMMATMRYLAAPKLRRLRTDLLKRTGAAAEEQRFRL